MAEDRNRLVLEVISSLCELLVACLPVAEEDGAFRHHHAAEVLRASFQMDPAQPASRGREMWTHFLQLN